MKIEVPGFLRGIREKQPEFTSEAERIFVVEQAAGKMGLRNADIWTALVQAVNEKNKLGLFWESNIWKIVDTYKDFKRLYPEENVPVSEVVYGADVANLDSDDFLSKVCFNYDYQLGGPKRLQELAEKWLKDGRQGSLEMSDFRYWTVDTQVQHDIARAYVNKVTAFRQTQDSDCSYSISQPGIEYAKGFRQRYQKNVLPFLEPDEMVKASNYVESGYIEMLDIRPKVVKVC